MTNEELIELMKEYPARKAEYMEQLYKQNSAVIFKIAKKYMKFMESEDLMQECYVILDEAVSRYEGNSGYKFTTYLSNLVKWRLSANIKSTYKIHTVSIDEPVSDEDGLTYSDILPSAEDIEGAIIAVHETAYRKQELYKAIDRLKPKEKTVIMRNRIEGKSIKLIAVDMGVSTNYCSILGKQGIANLRNDQELIKAIFNGEHYEDSDNYHYSVGRFRNSGLSSVESIAIKNEEFNRMIEEFRKQNDEQWANLIAQRNAV